MSYGKRLIQSASEALAIAQGRMEPAAIYVPENIDSAAARKSQKYSKAESVSEDEQDSASIIKYHNYQVSEEDFKYLFNLTK